MTRQEATQWGREEMNKWELKDWSLRLNQNLNSHFLGLCSHRDKALIVSAHHIDIHPETGCKEHIQHEVAHALSRDKGMMMYGQPRLVRLAVIIRCPCSNLSLVS